MNSCVLRFPLIWMSNNAESIWSKVGGKLRRPALHAFIIHCGTKSVRIAPPKKLTESYTQFFAKSPTVPQFYDSDTQIQTIYFYINGVNRLDTLVGSVRNLISLLKYTLSYYIVELYPTVSQYWAIPHPKALLKYSPSCYIAKQFRNSEHCWVIPNPNIFVEVYPIILHC